MNRDPHQLPNPRTETPKPRAEIIAETIDHALGPYLGVLPPEALQSMRDVLEDALATHPAATEALDALRGRQPMVGSGTRARGENDGDGDGDEPGGAA
jgi:hypothetical protein